ncbi:density-regulated protein isoform d [Mus musculus]|uniref:density-regulated protein isoform d n=1 Tax=Mus musculus TaxID=10090 RepID=UPI0023AB4608|nr:density-regulated protein isoform d [Mus musculus]
MRITLFESFIVEVCKMRRKEDILRQMSPAWWQMSHPSIQETKASWPGLQASSKPAKAT